MISKIKPFLLFFAVFLLSLQVIIDTDFGWHLRAGQYIFQTGSIPYHDLFSFSLPNYPYVYHSWAGEVLLYISYKIGGLYGSSIFYALVLTLCLFFVYKTTCFLTKNKPSSIIILASTLIFAALVGGRMRLFGLLFLSAIYYLFLKFRIQNSKTVWLIPFTIALWANFHGSFIVGIACLAIFTVFNYFFPANKNRQTKTLIIITLASALASLVNPYGFSAIKQAISMVFNSTVNLQHINYDWQPIASQDPTTLVLAALVLGLFLVSKLLKIKIDRFQMFLCVVFLIFSLVLLRFAFALYVFFIPLSTVLANQIVSKIKKPVLQNFSVKLAVKTVIIVLTLSAFQYPLETFSTYQHLETYNRFLTDKFQGKIKYPIWPYKAGEFLKKNNLVGKNLFAEADSTSFLILQNPSQKVFYYGAMDNYFYNGKSFAFEYITLINARGNWQQKLEEYKIDLILLPQVFPLGKKITTLSTWKKIYEDDQAAVFEKI